MPEGFIFGLLDNGIVLLGMYAGVDLERYISRKIGNSPNPILGAALGATLFNTLSDGIAAYFDPSMGDLTPGIMLGCALAMLGIPFLEKIRKKY